MIVVSFRYENFANENILIFRQKAEELRKIWAGNTNKKIELYESQWYEKRAQELEAKKKKSYFKQFKTGIIIAEFMEDENGKSNS